MTLLIVYQRKNQKYIYKTSSKNSIGLYTFYDDTQ